MWIFGYFDPILFSSLQTVRRSWDVFDYGIGTSTIGLGCSWTTLLTIDTLILLSVNNLVIPLSIYNLAVGNCLLRSFNWLVHIPAAALNRVIRRLICYLSFEL